MRIACFILLLLPILIFGQAPGCPNIQVDDETVDCNKIDRFTEDLSILFNSKEEKTI